ncbi:hypothetical protein NIES4103_07140 [Nostoc sp. NIES-4103]|nr:hypothetical protein NIES4103_07140 [Nostoc sp. NIES-4103]
MVACVVLLRKNQGVTSPEFRRMICDWFLNHGFVTPALIGDLAIPVWKTATYWVIQRCTPNNW